VGTIASYFEANMGLLREPPDFDLYDSAWVIHTKSEERPPAKLTDEARVVRSLISHGCTIRGTVESSLLSPGVFVAEGTTIRDSILMPDAIVGPGCVLDHVIVDKEAIIGKNCRIGWGDDLTPNQDEPVNLSTGLTVIGKGAHIPDGITVGRNVRFDADVSEADCRALLGKKSVVASGATVMLTSRGEDPFSSRALATLR
jgi:glucose-1-phosphate adenylyltransferase